MNYDEIIKNTIDMHVHVGPEIIPRKFTIPGLIKSEQGMLRGAVVKNHFFPTVVMNEQKADDFILIHSVTLNQYVGGFNPYVVESTAGLTNCPIVVWFPTIHAENILQNSEYEIPVEWLGGGKIRNYCSRKASDIQGLSIFDETGDIRQAVKNVLEVIKSKDAILATGHISWRESVALATYALDEVKINKIIITHPIYGHIAMPVSAQKDLTKKGVFIEHCYSMYSIDKILMRNIADQIKYVGAEQCIFSSDVGQVFSDGPSEALKKSIILLEKEGITEKEIKKMFVGNTSLLIS
ncbi:MAG: DUF6282 family protein [bacterium]